MISRRVHGPGGQRRRVGGRKQKQKTRGGRGPSRGPPPRRGRGGGRRGPWGTTAHEPARGTGRRALAACASRHAHRSRSRHAAQRARRDGLRKCANDSVLVLVLTMPSPLLRLPSGPKTCLAKTVIVVTHPSTPAHVALVTLWSGRRRETLRSARAYLWLSPIKLAELAPHLSLLCL